MSKIAKQFKDQDIATRNRFLTVEEVAKNLQLSTTTIYSLIRKKELAFTRRDGRLMIAYKDLYEIPVRGRGHPVVNAPEDKHRVQTARATDEEVEAWTRAAEKKHGGLIGPWLRDVANAAAALSTAQDQEIKAMLIDCVKKVPTP